ncbi:hypothetical protein ASF98_21265 [Arthrobacter sp. Leaf337]|uniref:hypothetical protein n=1 Tax=Arthrobacter sp. Leaf337 TaxID=1736342 RepID=UPI0006F82894|nr:hypothetical protein [Arthrobacter sp. Leaf337]KQR77280.1 hypothetical protein ASF98_21265 [Arthrobacter sp. Leaf337]
MQYIPGRFDIEVNATKLAHADSVLIIVTAEPNTLPSNFTTKWKEITPGYIEELNGEIPEVLIPHIAAALPRVTTQETLGLRADGTRYLTV